MFFVYVQIVNLMVRMSAAAHFALFHYHVTGYNGLYGRYRISEDRFSEIVIWAVLVAVKLVQNLRGSLGYKVVFF